MRGGASDPCLCMYVAVRLPQGVTFFVSIRSIWLAAFDEHRTALVIGECDSNAVGQYSSLFYFLYFACCVRRAQSRMSSRWLMLHCSRPVLLDLPMHAYPHVPHGDNHSMFGRCDVDLNSCIPTLGSSRLENMKLPPNFLVFRFDGP